MNARGLDACIEDTGCLERRGGLGRGGVLFLPGQSEVALHAQDFELGRGFRVRRAIDQPSFTHGSDRLGIGHGEGQFRDRGAWQAQFEFRLVGELLERYRDIERDLVRLFALSAQPQDVLFRGGVEFDPVLAWALIAGLGPHHGLGHAERNPHPAWLIDDDRDLDREFGMSLVGLTTCGETLELKARGLLAEPKLGPLGHEALEVFEGETEDCLQQAAVFISEEQHRWLGLFDRPFDGRRHFLGGRAARRVHGGAGDGCR